MKLRSSSAYPSIRAGYPPLMEIRERGDVVQGWEIDLPIHPTAVGVARRAFIARFRLEMSAVQLRDAALLVSELVGHAFVAGPPITTLRLTGQVWAGGVRLTVQDDRRAHGGQRVPSLQEPSLPHAIVTALAEAFGERRVNGMTIMWCELHRGGGGPRPWPLSRGGPGGSRGP